MGNKTVNVWWETPIVLRQRRTIKENLPFLPTLSLSRSHPRARESIHLHGSPSPAGGRGVGDGGCPIGRTAVRPYGSVSPAGGRGVGDGGCPDVDVAITQNHSH